MGRHTGTSFPGFLSLCLQLAKSPFHVCQYVVGGKDKRDECWLDVWAYRSSAFDFCSGVPGGEENEIRTQQQKTNKRGPSKDGAGGRAKAATGQSRPKPSGSAGAAIRLKCHWEEEIRVLGLPCNIGLPLYPLGLLGASFTHTHTL
jgi:hypothetical protein